MPVSLRLQECIGSGSISSVYRAVESDGRVVALKKSRVSQRYKRTALKHEASVLQLLHGHPTIPDVFAYSHLPHFEYLSMQLLGESLSDAVEKRGPLPVPVVATIAIQMLDALQHVHNFGLVHRDIKPDNIVFKSTQDNNLDICLIDFGMATKAAVDAPDIEHEPYSFVTGTLTFASLYAHASDQLSYRDDLESLAYSLFELVIGRLPWAVRYPWHGTHFGRARQVYHQKKNYNGKMLATSHIPQVFADILDDSRQMSAKERPDYDALRLAFSNHTAPQSLLPPSQETTSEDDSDSISPPPVQVGQVVVIQIESRLSIETPELRANFSSFIADSTIDDDELKTSPRLGVVIAIAQAGHAHVITVAGIGCLAPNVNARVVASPLDSFLNTTKNPEPQWSAKDVVFYAFRRAFKFSVEHSHVVIPKTHWVQRAALKRIARELVLLQDKLSEPEQLRSQEPDVRYNARLNQTSTSVFVSLGPVPEDGNTLKHLLSNTTGGRGWFDEYVRVVRQLDMDSGEVQWTNTPFAERVQKHREGLDFDESYFEVDFELWQPVNRERSRALTLSNCDGLPSEAQLLCGLDTITSIVDETRQQHD